MTASIQEKTEFNEVPATQPLAIRWFAVLTSYVFHPLFIPVYITFFLLFIHPMLFAGYEYGAKLRLMATVFVNLTLLPAVTVFLCWRLKFIDNMYMKTQKERIIPLAAAMVFYFWCWFVLRNFAALPELFRQFLLGSFIIIIAAWLANIYYKVSLHGLAAGGMVSFLLVLMFTSDGGSAWHIALATLLAGAVCSSRIILGAHRPVEVYSAFIIGFFCQLLAVWL